MSLYLRYTCSCKLLPQSFLRIEPFGRQWLIKAYGKDAPMVFLLHLLNYFFTTL